MTTTPSTRSHDHAVISPFFSLLSIILMAATLRTPLTGVGPLLSHIRASTGLGAAAAGLLGTLPLLALGLGALAAPALGRRWGLERAMFHSTVLLCFGIVLRSVPGISPLFIGTAVLGAAIAVGNVLLPALIKREYPQRSGQITGLFVVTLALTAGIAAGVAVPLAECLPGSWHTSLAVCALVICVPAAFVWLARARHPSAQASAAAPAVPHANVWRFWLAWQVTLLNGFQAFSFFALFAWLPSMLLEMNGTSALASGWLLTMLQILALFGSLTVSFLLGRFRDQRGIGLVTSLLCMLGMAGLALYPAWAVLWIGCAGFGLGSSLMLALACISLRSSSTPQAASLSAMTQSVGYMVGAAGPFVCGLLRELVPNWQPILWGLAVWSVVQAGMAYGAGRKLQIGERTQD